MNNNKALEFANDFIKNSIFTKTNIKLDKPFETIFNDEILENDPNLKILKNELNKIGFDITKTHNQNHWTIFKIN